MLVLSTDEMIFEPYTWKSSVDELLVHCEKYASYIHEDILQEAKNNQDSQILALSTCSYEFDNARTIVLALMEPSEL